MYELTQVNLIVFTHPTFLSTICTLRTQTNIVRAHHSTRNYVRDEITHAVDVWLISLHICILSLSRFESFPASSFVLRSHN